VSKTALLAAAGLIFASAFPAAAQNTNLERARALIAQVQAQQAQGQGTPQGGLPAVAPVNAPFRTPGPVVDLGIESAVQRAMEKNIDIAVARITPRLTDFTIAGLEANYRVNLTSATSTNSNTRLPQRITQEIGRASCRERV